MCDALVRKDDVAALPPPSTRRGHAARLAVLDAGRRVFESSGYFGAKIADIVSESGFSTGSFYRYFRNKEDLLLELIQEVSEELYQASRHHWNNADVRKSLHETSSAYLEACHKNRAILTAIQDFIRVSPEAAVVWERTQTDVRRRMERYVRQALAENHDDLDPHLATLALTSMVELFAERVLVKRAEQEVTIDLCAEVLAKIWYRAIFTPTLQQGGQMAILTTGSDGNSSATRTEV